ncbi:heat shock factor protein isoform X1 [Ochlerotatus camptorhynchus]|uniref:heat shock factor protein isoform X1 n=1 Tax=Ochlerotatus camptorhynchus TaxID=644619 RepID=UPI0031CF9A04
MHTFTETGTGVPAFLAKLWRLVEDPETNDLISWSSDGRSFIIQNQAQFAKELLPLNYKHNNMASFIRQLNMYGFHKITSIDNGGLRFDKDEMEFTHPCFQKDHPYLLEHIKRKIATSKQQPDDKGGLKVEAMNRVLTEMKQMRGRQETLDSRFSSMKQENEALWREIAILRQKHLKQQQIVNKLIQFLVTIVQPSRSGLGSMGNGSNKRRFQLMINDAPQSKLKKTEGNEGATIQELGEALEEVAYENEQELLSQEKEKSTTSGTMKMEKPQKSKSSTSTTEIPEVTSPISMATQQSPYHSGNGNEIIEEAVSPMSVYNSHFGTANIKQESFDHSVGITESAHKTVSDVTDDGENVEEYDDEAYLVDHVDEINSNSMQYFDDTDMLNTPMVLREMQKQEQLKQQQTMQQQKAVNKGESLLKNKKNGIASKDQQSLLTSNKSIHSTMTNNSNDVTKSGKKVISSAKQAPVKSAVNLNAGPSGTNSFASTVKPSTLSMGYGVEDFNVDEMPADIFDDDSHVQKESPMLGAFNFEGGFYNPNVNINEIKGKQMLPQPQPQLQQQQQHIQQNVSNPVAHLDEQEDDSSNNGAMAKFVSSGADINKLNSMTDFGQHFETVQTDLDSLKDLLKGDGYQLDANTLLGAAGGSGPQYGRVYFTPTSFDADAFNKLFNSNDDIMGMDLPMNLPEMAESQRKAAVDGAITTQVSNSNDTNNVTGHLSPTPSTESSNQLMTYKLGSGTNNACDYIDLNELLNFDDSNDGQSTLT